MLTFTDAGIPPPGKGLAYIELPPAGSTRHDIRYGRDSHDACSKRIGKQYVTIYYNFMGDRVTSAGEETQQCDVQWGGGMCVLATGLPANLGSTCNLERDALSCRLSCQYGVAVHV